MNQGIQHSSDSTIPFSGDHNTGLEPLLTVDQAAEYLGLKPKRINELVREGKLACVQLSPRERRFTVAQLQAFIASRTLTPPKTVDVPARVPLPSHSGDMKSLRGDRAQIRKELRQWR